MTKLIRESVGPFHVSQSVNLDDITERTIESLLLPAIKVVADLPMVQVQGRMADVASTGNPVPLSATSVVQGDITQSDPTALRRHVLGADFRGAATEGRLVEHPGNPLGSEDHDGPQEWCCIEGEAGGIGGRHQPG